MTQDKAKPSKMVKLKFNQISVNQKYLKKNDSGKSLWDEAREEYIANFIKNPMFGGMYKFVPNEDSVIQNMLVQKYGQPYVFNRATRINGIAYTLDEIREMTDKERSGLPFYEMSMEDALFYIDPAQTKTVPRDDTIRVYKYEQDFKRDCLKIPLAEIVD